MTFSSKHAMRAVLGCFALGLLLVTAGCGGCSPRKDTPAPATGPAAEPAAPARVLEPEEAPSSELDAQRRDFLRNHETVLQLLGQSPRLTHESDQDTPRFTITVYKAETVDRTVRLRMNWETTARGLNVLRIDVQHREDGGFERAWVAGG